MGTREPELTVCIPTWNGATTIRRTLDLVLAQEGIDLRVLVSDDASSDETCELVEAGADPRIELLRNDERAGMVGNWNRCLAHAETEFLIVMGQDDTVDPGWARGLTAALRAHPDAAMAFCRRRFEIEEGVENEGFIHFFTKVYPALLEEFYAGLGTLVQPETMVRAALRNNFEINLIGEPAFSCFRRDHPAVRQGFDPKMTQLMDWEFHTRFFSDGPIVFCPQVLGTFQVREQGASAEHYEDPKRHMREVLHLLGLVRDRFTRLLQPADQDRIEARMAELRHSL